MGNKNTKTKTRRYTEALSDDEITALEGSTRYNRDEIKGMHGDFIGDYPKGTINKEQFVQGYKKHPLIKSSSSKYFEKLFEAFDSDQSGEIEFSEYLIALSVLQFGTSEDKLRLIFEQFDTDKNGKITSQELVSMITAIYKLNNSRASIRSNRSSSFSINIDAKEKAREIMRKLDSDNNGTVSIAEFVSGCLADEELKQFLAPLIYVQNS